MSPKESEIKALIIELREFLSGWTTDMGYSVASDVRFFEKVSEIETKARELRSLVDSFLGGPTE